MHLRPSLSSSPLPHLRLALTEEVPTKCGLWLTQRIRLNLWLTQRISSTTEERRCSSTSEPLCGGKRTVTRTLQTI